MRVHSLVLGAAILLLACGVATAETVTYAYDAAGRLTHVYYPDGSIEYVYDPAGNLLQRIVTAGNSPSPIEPSMTAQRVGPDLAIAYATDVCVAGDHALFVGSLGDFTTVEAGDCSIGNSGDVTIPLPVGDAWFLVAGVEGTSFSSVGAATAGERVLSGVDAACPSFTADTRRTCP